MKTSNIFWWFQSCHMCTLDWCTLIMIQQTYSGGQDKWPSDFKAKLTSLSWKLACLGNRWMHHQPTPTITFIQVNHDYLVLFCTVHMNALIILHCTHECFPELVTCNLREFRNYFYVCMYRCIYVSMYLMSFLSSFYPQS